MFLLIKILFFAVNKPETAGRRLRNNGVTMDIPDAPIKELMEHVHPRGFHASSTFGARAADAVAAAMGSWRFIIIQTVVVSVWISLNTIALINHWDVYPFVLLNLLFSTQAAYSAPIIIQSQNRAAAIDRQQAINAYDQISEIDKLQKQQMKLLSLLEEVHDQVVK